MFFMDKFCSAEEAVASIGDGQTVGSVGVIGWITPDRVLKTLAARFLREGHPRNLTFYFPCGTGDGVGIRGMDHVAIEGLMKRIVSGSYINPVNPATGRRPELMRLIRENAIEAYSWPIGASMHWLREVARRSPGYLTEIGLGCYIDPDQTGGRLTARAIDNLVEKIDFRGKPYLFYPTWNVDVAIIRAGEADEAGNLSFETEALMSSSLALALAAKACGGTVIAQVARRVPRGARRAQTVKIPGQLVDHVVLDPQQMMTTDVQQDEAYLGGQPFDAAKVPKVAFGPDKIIARRAAQEVRPGIVSIFGFGASSDTPLVMSEQGTFDQGRLADYAFTTEHGPFGGLVMSNWQFSANRHPEAVLDGLSQFDFIDGGNCEFAALAFAQFDAQGNVNVSKFGSFNPGAGGFIDIAHNARDLVFTGTFTTAGLQIDAGAKGLSIGNEGKVRKFVNQVEQITYPVREGVIKRGQRAKIITERAVFDVTADGVVLTEVARGIDIRRDILERMEFAPAKILEPMVMMQDELFVK
jgi:propionate CoA-transferase